MSSISSCLLFIMPFFSDQPELFLAEVEEYLAEGPKSGDEQLKDIAVWLTEFEWKHDVPTTQMAVQILGTAVGRQSKSASFCEECSGC